MGTMFGSYHSDRSNTARPTITPDTPAAEMLAAKEFWAHGVYIRVLISQPEQYETGHGWRCRVRIERGDTRFEQSQVVAPDEISVVRLAIDLLTSRLGLSETQFFDGAHIGSRATALWA